MNAVAARQKSLKSNAWAKLVSESLSSKKSVRPKIADVRDSALDAGREVASGISQSWNEALRSEPGPVLLMDMFSGCGGMSTGFRAVNSLAPIFDLRGAVDIDDRANQSFALNHRIEPLKADLRALANSPKKLKEFLDLSGFGKAQPKVLIGCAPCQGFSSHRNEQGQSDPRNSLFIDFAKIARAISPDAVVVENVPELLTDRFWPIVVKARKILEEAGYFVHVNVHNMAEYGVPQQRFRALMLAMKRPFEAPRGFLSHSEFFTVRDAIGALPPVAAGEVDSKDAMHFSAGHQASTIRTIQAVPKDGGNRPESVGPECLRRAKSRSGKAAYEDVYGRLAWSKPAITITAYARNPASGRFVHPEQDRGLTVREAALLQSFPASYQFVGGLDERFRQIGNAVPPAFAAFLATHIVSELAAPSIKASDFDKGITGPVGASFSRMIPGLKRMKRVEVQDGA